MEGKKISSHDIAGIEETNGKISGSLYGEDESFVEETKRWS